MLKYFFSDKIKLSKCGFDYQIKYSFEDRKNASSRIKSKYYGRVPVIVEKYQLSTTLKDIPNGKYITPVELSVAKLLQSIRENINLQTSEALFIFVIDGNGKSIIPALSENMGLIYSKHANADGFLYVMYCSENCFG